MYDDFEINCKKNFCWNVLLIGNKYMIRDLEGWLERTKQFTITEVETY